MKLIIAEKKELAEDIAAALTQNIESIIIILKLKITLLCGQMDIFLD